MTEGERRFLDELEQEIERHSEKREIIAEYHLHVFDLLEEVSIDEAEVYDELVHRLGSPKEIAALWKRETAVTPKRTQQLFVFCNIAVFVAGVLLTIGYNVFDWRWLEGLWAGLTNATSIIILIYSFFWALLGYEIGKEFGHRGYKLLKKTFLFSVVPNLVLMYLIVFRLVPHHWFQPLLSTPFIIVCILCTAILYPISWLGYWWGRKASV